MPSVRFGANNGGSLAASQVVANLMAGSQFEFMQRVTRIQIYAVQDAADLVTMEVFFGQELELPPSLIAEAAAGIGPIVPDNLILDDIAAPNDRLVIRLVETGAIPGITRTVVVLTPL